MVAVYIVIAHGNPIDLGDWIEGVFSTKEKAENWASKNVFSDFTIEVWDIDKTD